MSPSRQPKRTFVIDSSCIIELQNDHGAPPGMPKTIYYTHVEQQRAWSELRKLAGEGQIKIVDFVESEVLRKSETGYNNLKSLPKTSAQKNADVANRYREIIAKYPEWEPDPDEYEDADPWIVAFASVRNWEVLSEEKRLAEQSPRNSSHCKIPDACDFYLVNCSKLRQLADECEWFT